MESTNALLQLLTEISLCEIWVIEIRDPHSHVSEMSYATNKLHVDVHGKFHCVPVVLLLIRFHSRIHSLSVYA